MEIFRSSYKEKTTIQQATLHLINTLFGGYGLVIFIPDNTVLKKLFQLVIQKKLTEQFSHKAVEQTVQKLEAHYKVQASGRKINLFYLIDDKRERIEIQNSKFKIQSLEIEFTPEEILKELDEHPERFSPNVILRGVFQETILPNIAFIGGGGELAYWLELKKVFETVAVPYPVLILRNSFLIAEQKWKQKIDELALAFEELFLSEHHLMNRIVARKSTNNVAL